MPITWSEIPVPFHGEGAGTGDLTWGQLGILRTTERTGRTMNVVVKYPLPEGTPLTEMTALLGFMVSRHPALRTRLRFVDELSGQRHPRQIVAGSGVIPLVLADIDERDDPAAVAEDLRSRFELTFFDYENELPVRMGLVRRSGALLYMVAAYSHVLLDGAGLSALVRDLDRLDRATGEATAPPSPAPNPLSIARDQGGPAGRRQSARSVRYWAAQLDRLGAWDPDMPPHPREPRFWELAGYSPAMELGLRMVAARTGVGTTYVLLAAYAAAAARVFGRDPGVAQIVVNNRFRPGFADLVSQISQHGICVVDVGDAPFDEVVARAHKAVTSASFCGYYDPAECAPVFDDAAARGLDISWHLNDRRVRTDPADGSAFDDACELSVREAELKQLLGRSKFFWDRRQPVFDGALFLQVDSEPMYAERQVLMEEVPAVYLEVWTDTHRFSLHQVEAFVREMEAVVVDAALDPGAAGAAG